jgi:dienelactone hydrolase
VHQIPTFDACVVGKGVLGIVVIQEWWGVNFEIKKHAIDITSKGLSCPDSSVYQQPQFFHPHFSSHFLIAFSIASQLLLVSS